MADSKITALDNLTSADPANDMIPIVDVSDTPPASGNTKRISINNILACSPSATLASATITGDLTVDTSTLKVDSANNRVGIGTATPAAELHVIGGANFSDGTTTLRAVSSGNVAFLGTTTTDPLVLRVNNIEQYRIAQLGVFTWSDGAGSTRMTLNATGLGIGVVGANGIKLSSFVTTDGAPATSGTSQTSGSLRIGAVSTTGAMDMGTAGSYSWIQVLDRGNLATNYDLVLQPNGGKLLVGQTSVGEDGVVSIKGSNGLGVEATANGGSTYNAKYSGTGTGYFGYFKYGTTLVGTIASTGAGNCTFNQVSDYRLKEDVQPIVGALNRINSLKPSTYKWKVNGSAGEGFLAHELAAGVPLAVTGEKDAVNEDGSIQPQQVDLSKVVPILVAAIKELTARVQTLEAK